MKIDKDKKSQEPTNEKKGDGNMSNQINKEGITGLTPDKIKILKELQGAASSPLDLNKVRDEWKYDKD